MDRPSIINTFERGVIADYDKQRVPNKNLKFSLNGRIIFARDGTISWNNGLGNKIALAIPFDYGNFDSGVTPNYYIISGIEIKGVLVIFSTQNTVQNNISGSWLYSEIGILSEVTKGNYTYQTIFNDQYDYYGQLLHFTTRYQIKAQANFENDSTIRIYYGDDFNDDRAFNIESGATAQTINDVNYFANGSQFNYQPYTLQPTQGNNGIQNPVTGAKYPYWYSVHGMSELMDVQFGLTKYVKNIPGTLVCGERQYFYRLVHQSGMFTPWTPGGGMIFVTPAAVNPDDWTQYGMAASGTTTYKGHQLFIKGIDTRFSYIEVAVAYYPASGVQPSTARIFFQGPISLVDEIVQGLPTGALGMYISHISDNYIVPLTPAQLIQRYTDVLHSKTHLTNENYLHKSNVVIRPNLTIDTSGITIEPFLRLMASDTQEAVSTTPITNGMVTTLDAVEVSLFAGQTEQYVLGDNTAGGEIDYVNYKGTQWASLFKGDFRGQTTPYCIVLWGRKGQFYFAQHIGDFTQPEQYSNEWSNTVLDAEGNPVTTTGTTGNVGDYTLTNDSTTPLYVTNNITNIDYGTPSLNILGKKISGIDLTDYLYDVYGDIQLAGFSIVRADRIPNLIAQGLVMNCTTFAPQGAAPILGYGNFLSPLHSTGNAYFYLAPAPFNGYVPINDPTKYQGGTVHFYNQTIDHGWTGFPIIDSGNKWDGQIAGNFFTLELPDNLINPAIISALVQGNIQAENVGFNLQLVGNVKALYLSAVEDSSCNTGQGQQGIQPTPLAFTDFYTKNYSTDFVGNNLIGSDQIGGQRVVGVSNTVGDFGSIASVEKIWVPYASSSNTSGGSSPVAVGTVNDTDNYRFSNVAFLQDFFKDVFGIDCQGAYHAQGTNTQVVVRSGNYVNAALALGFLNQPQSQNWANPICYYLANIVTGQENILNQSIVSGRTYQGIGHFIPINSETIAAATQSSGRVVFNDIEVWGGDCYVDYFDYGRLIPLYDNTNSSKETPAFFDYGCGLIFPCETVYNHTMRIGNTFSQVALRPGVDEVSIADSDNPVFYSGLYANANDSKDARLEDFLVNSVLQASDEVAAYNVPSVYFKNISDFPLLEMYAGPKIAGEIYDSFRQFLPNNQQLADSKYGFVTDLQAIGANIFEFQEKGFSRMRFNERALESTPQENLTVGSALGYSIPGHQNLGGADYGCQHQWGIVNNGKSLLWVNAYKGKHVRYGANGLEPLSDIHGQHFYFQDNSENYWGITNPLLQDTNENLYDNPTGIGGISGIYDFTNNEQLTTFTRIMTAPGTEATPPGTEATPPVYIGKASTMAYQQQGEFYGGNWSFTPGIYLGFKQDFLAPSSINPDNLMVYNEGAYGNWDGVVHPSIFELVVTPELNTQYIFDNAEINTNPDAYGIFENVRITTINGVQNVVLNNLAVDSRPIYRNAAIIYPTMQINQSTRVRGSYAEFLYLLDNAPNEQVTVTSHKTYVRKDRR